MKAFTPLTESPSPTSRSSAGTTTRSRRLSKRWKAAASPATLAIERGFGQRLGMTLGEMEQLQASLPGARWVDGGPALAATRAIKSQVEIECLRQACEITCLGVKDGFDQLHAGMTERRMHAIMVVRR